MKFQDATNTDLYARLAIIGGPGSGKTFTGLKIGRALAGDRPLFVIDTEHGSSRKYSKKFKFQVTQLAENERTPAGYCEAIKLAVHSGAGCILIDSATHEWDACRRLVDQIGKGWAGWKDVTPKHQAFIDTIVAADCHIIATFRSKVEYVIEKDSRGRDAPRKVGTAPITREDTEYEFDMVMLLDQTHVGSFTKSRCDTLADRSFDLPGAEVAQAILDWLAENTEEAPEVAVRYPHLSAGMIAKIDQAMAEAENHQVSYPALTLDADDEAAKLWGTRLYRLTQYQAEYSKYQRDHHGQAPENLPVPSWEIDAQNLLASIKTLREGVKA